jgi:LPXTG-motif cell wall-anchored protein
MPRTGESLPTLTLAMILLSAVLLGAGMATRRRAPNNSK